jgi:hypothetical protein
MNRLNKALDWLAARPAWNWLVFLGGAGVVLLVVMVVVMRILFQPRVPVGPRPQPSARP